VSVSESTTKVLILFQELRNDLFGTADVLVQQRLLSRNLEIQFAYRGFHFCDTSCRCPTNCGRRFGHTRAGENTSEVEVTIWHQTAFQTAETLFDSAEG
jgi:hypothetical protein